MPTQPLTGGTLPPSSATMAPMAPSIGTAMPVSEGTLLPEGAGPMPAAGGMPTTVLAPSFAGMPTTAFPPGGAPDQGFGAAAMIGDRAVTPSAQGVPTQMLPSFAAMQTQTTSMPTMVVPNQQVQATSMPNMAQTNGYSTPGQPLQQGFMPPAPSRQQSFMPPAPSSALNTQPSFVMTNPYMDRPYAQPPAGARPDFEKAMSYEMPQMSTSTSYSPVQRDLSAPTYLEHGNQPEARVLDFDTETQRDKEHHQQQAACHGQMAQQARARGDTFSAIKYEEAAVEHARKAEKATPPTTRGKAQAVSKTKRKKRACHCC